jgi:hypothetical protein
MRVDMTKAVGARVVIGGRLDSYSGLYPGIIEEAWLSLIVKQPLFLVGAFGEAARAVTDALTTGNPETVLAACDAPHRQECLARAETQKME